MIGDFTSSFTGKSVSIIASDTMFQNTMLVRVDNPDGVFTNNEEKAPHENNWMAAAMKVTFLTSNLSNLGTSTAAYPPVVRSWVELGSTCGILGHSHHRTAAGPVETQQN